MGFQALRITRESGGSPVPTTVDPTSDEALRDLFSVEQATVFVAENAALDRLASLSESMLDRGEKHRATPLSKLLLGHQGIPLVRGSYSSAGQLLRSVRTLLENAERVGECKPYFVGAHAAVLEDLRARASIGRAPSSGASQAGQGRSRRAGGRTGRGAGQPPSLLDLLPPMEVPEELDRRYVGHSEAAQIVRQLILLAAKQNEPVLVIGGTGTGKEIVARSIHEYGKRWARTFTPVNCGAIPHHLLESELFGHKKGAFTGAIADKMGLWKLAGSGTLFLDEIGDLSIDHQAKILRVLQEGTILPVGGTKEIKVEARIVAATNRDLFTMVQGGSFREDLLYRLCSFIIRTPSLRAHPDDIPRLAGHFWRNITPNPNATLPESVMKELKDRPWPGNARELRAVLANLHALFGHENVGVEHLMEVFRLQGQELDAAPFQEVHSEMDFRHVQHIVHMRRVEDALGACREVLKPLAEDPGLIGELLTRVRTGLQRCLLELSTLCDPRLFPSETSFLAAHKLNGRLSYLEMLLYGDPSEARLRRWNEVAEEMDDAQRTVANAIRLLNEDG
jgi:hypothetical protein